jgi:Clp amino terminal domain, pathogenicity island component
MLESEAPAGTGGPQWPVHRDSGEDGFIMFERFTDRARRAVVLANEEARLLGHDQIGTEHILLGLLREGGGVGGRALRSLDISLEEAREHVSAAVGAGSGKSAHIPFTQRAKTALERALREALQLGHEYIGTEHILLGLLRDEKDSAVQIIAELGADRAAVRWRVLQLVPGEFASSRVPPAASPGPRVRVRPDDETTVQFDTLDSRLTAIEQWVGVAPGLAELDHELMRVRQDKETAIDAHDYRTAEDLSETETELLLDRDRRVRGWAGQPTLAAEVAELRSEVAQLSAEVARLRAARAGRATSGSSDRAQQGGRRRAPAGHSAAEHDSEAPVARREEQPGGATAS